MAKAIEKQELAAKEPPELSGPQTAALVILSMGEDIATNVMRHMTETDLIHLSKVVDELDPIPYANLAPALRTFERRLREPVISGKGGEYMRKLYASLAKKKSNMLIVSKSGLSR